MPAVAIKDKTRFWDLLPLHGWDRDDLPYNTTYALPLYRVQKFDEPVPYKHHEGAIGVLRFEPIHTGQGGSEIDMGTDADDEGEEHTASASVEDMVKNAEVMKVLRLEDVIERCDAEQRCAPEALREPERRLRYTGKMTPRPEDRPLDVDAEDRDDEIAQHHGRKAIRKRPAAALVKKHIGKRDTQPSHFCPGDGNRACCFTRDRAHLGQAARLRRGERKCTFCCPLRMAAAVATPSKKKDINRALREFQAAGRKDLLAAAFAKIPDTHHASINNALKRQSRAKGAVQLRAEEREVANSWRTLLRNRTKIMEPLDDEEAQKYRRQCRDDQRRITRKFADVLQAQEDGDDSWRSDVASAFEKWCVEKSWVMCAECHRLEKRPCHEADMKKSRRSHTIKKCKYCKDGTGYATVQISDIPEELRGLLCCFLMA